MTKKEKFLYLLIIITPMKIKDILIIAGSGILGAASVLGYDLITRRAEPQRPSSILEQDTRNSELERTIVREIERSIDNTQAFYNSKERSIFLSLGKQNDAGYSMNITPENAEFKIALNYNGPEKLQSNWIDIILDEKGKFVKAEYFGKTKSQDGPLSLDDPVLGTWLKGHLAKAQEKYELSIKHIAAYCRQIEEQKRKQSGIK